MQTVDRRGIHIEQCQGCRGIFLDRGELEQIANAEKSHYAAPAAPGTPPQYAPPPVAPGHAPPPPAGYPAPQPGYGQPAYGHGGYRDSPPPYGHGGYRDSPPPYGHGGHKRRKGFMEELFG